MAPKHPSRLFDDPPSASPSHDHDEEEEEEEVEEEEMEVLEEPEIEKTEVEGSEKEEEEDADEEEEEEEEEDGVETDVDTIKKFPQITKLSQTSKNQSLDESSEEKEGSETDDDITKNSPPNTPQITKISQISKNQSLDGSSEEEEEGSDDNTTKNSPTASSFIIKPVVNKNNHSIEPKNPTTKRALIDAEKEKVLPKKAKVGKDHHSEEDREGTAKRVGRVWNEADEISILEGMIDYQKKKGAEAQADMTAFLEFVKGRFKFDVTRTQLYEKVRRLRLKFIANRGKGEKFVPTNPHDLERFKLSKKIWGGNNASGSVDDSGSKFNERIVDDGVDHTENVNIVDGAWVTKKSDKSKSSDGEWKEKVEKKKRESDKKSKKKMKMDDGPKIVEEVAKPVTEEDVSKDKEYVTMHDENAVKDNGQNIALKYPNLVASLSMYTESQRKLMMEGICLVDSEKASKLEDGWKELCMKETEVYCRKMELLAEQSRLVVDAWKKR